MCYNYSTWKIHIKGDCMKQITRKMKEEVVRLAQEKHPGEKITPCKKVKTIMSDKSYTIFECGGVEYLMLWYNTSDGSTHIVRKAINEKNEACDNGFYKRLWSAVLHGIKLLYN